jgi:hypothetical protein
MCNDFKAGAASLAFRRKYPDDRRGLELLDLFAALAKWETRPSPQKARAVCGLLRVVV